MPRFVVQHHVFADGDEHWDLMFEVRGVLWTWSLPAPPDRAERLPVCARELPDHRTKFLDYEGDVSADRGRVEIHDRGTYRWEDDAPAAPRETLSVVVFHLTGERAAGRYQLRRAPLDGKDLWRLRRLA